MLRRLPIVIFLGILLTVGLPGNICVLVIFVKHYKENAFRIYRIFIVTLAIFDTIACSICIPFEILDLVFVLTFYNEAACKIFRTLELFVTMATVFVTFNLTLFRYLRVCQYKKPQMTEKIAKILCGVSLPLCIVLASPFSQYTGITEIDLPQNITGYDCYISEDFTGSNLDFFKVIGAILGASYMLAMAGIVIMYILIGKKLYKRASANKRQHQITSSSDEEKTNDDLNDKICDDSSAIENYVENNTELYHINNTPKFGQQNSKDSGKSREEIEFDNTRKRLTGISFAVSFLFIVSYLPILVPLAVAMQKYNASPEDAYEFAPFVPTFLLRVIWVSNIGNPIIYLLFDVKYRGHVMECFSKRR